MKRMQQQRSSVNRNNSAFACTASGEQVYSGFSADVSGTSAFFFGLPLRAIIYLLGIISNIKLFRRAYPAH